MKIEHKYSVTDILILLTLIMLVAMKNIVLVAVYGWMIPAVLILVGYIQSKGWVVRKNSLAFIVPYLCFFMWGFFSYLWAADTSLVISRSFVMLRLYGAAFIFSLLMFRIADIEKLLRMLYIAGIVALGHLFLRTPLDIWRESLYGDFSASTDEGRLGYTIGYHPNELGQFCFVIFMLSLYLYNKEKKKRYLIINALTLIVLFFTKSRTSILMVAVGVIVYFLLSERKVSKKIVVIVTGVAVLVFAYVMIFNNPVLYRLVGFRFEGILGSTTEQDASTSARMALFKYAMKLFKENPVLGVGLDNFRYYAVTYADAWAQVTSHSNWGELLSCTGIVGTGLYYVPQIIAAISLLASLKRLDSDRRKLCAILLTLLFVNITFDLVKTSYDKFLVLFQMSLAVVGAKLFRGEIKERK